MVGRVFLISLAVICTLAASSLGQTPARIGQLRAFLHGIQPQREGMGSGLASGDREPKCGLWLAMQVAQRWGHMSGVQRETLVGLLAPPMRQKERISPPFRFFYDTTGIHTPALLDGGNQAIHGTAEAFVDSAARAFHRAWAVMVDSLGYKSPPLEADTLYHVYISDLGYGLYGVTYPYPPIPINPSGPPRYKTYLEIENDFAGVYPPSRGIPGLKVTAAHELHHAIQIGAYGTWDVDRYFYEITSTSMEEVVFDEVNDYLQYLSNNPLRFSHFSHPELAFTLANGSIEYSRCIWGLYLERRYGFDLMRGIWERIPNMATLDAMESALKDRNATFREAFAEFAYWNTSTGVSADTVRFYKEGNLYPEIRMGPMLEFIPPSRSIADSMQAIASLYRHIIVMGNPMLVVISNINVGAAYTIAYYHYTYEMTQQLSDGYRQLTNGVAVRLGVPDPENWFAWESVPSVTNDVIVYPNPFSGGRGRTLKFRLPGSGPAVASLTILSTGMSRIYAADLPTMESPTSETRCEWDGMTDGGRPAPSGVYFFVVQAAGRTYKGKFSILRDDQ